MNTIKKLIFDLIFPIQCLGCKKEGEWLCQECFDRIEINPAQLNPAQKNQLFSGIWVVTVKDQTLVNTILHNFKYNLVLDLGEILGSLAIKFLTRLILQDKNLHFDYIVAVPLSKKRKLWRGFNQSEVIAQKISQQFVWPNNFSLIYRHYHNRPQVGLNALQRQENVKGIFRADNNESLENKKILIIDDVLTTGATLNESAKALKAAGVKEIWGLVIIRG
ncbi:MAG: phosphoribosyltransferase family protein [Patescibacteria group bacterium]